MTFTAYIQRQKSLIRSRRDTEYTILRSRQIIAEYDRDLLLEDLISLKGLNTEERQQYSKIFSHA